MIGIVLCCLRRNVLQSQCKITITFALALAFAMHMHIQIRIRGPVRFRLRLRNHSRIRIRIRIRIRMHNHDHINNHNHNHVLNRMHNHNYVLERACDKASPPSLSKATKDFATHPSLVTATLREELGGRNVERSAEVLAVTTVEVEAAEVGLSDQERTWSCWSWAVGHTQERNEQLRLLGRKQRNPGSKRRRRHWWNMAWCGKAKSWSTQGGKTENHKPCNLITKTKGSQLNT